MQTIDDEAVVRAIVDRDFGLMRERVHERVTREIAWATFINRALIAFGIVLAAIAVYEGLTW